MVHPIYHPMKICGHVKDTCCTVADEIKISKLWNERARPMLDAHGDEYLLYIKKILNTYWEMMSIDPRYTILTYVDYKKVPYKNTICTAT